MTKEEELIKQALEMFKDHETIYMPSHNSDIFFRWAHGKGKEKINRDSYTFCNDKELFRYDHETDTLTNWGRGLGIVYCKGVWAQKVPFPKFEEINYQIY